MVFDRLKRSICPPKLFRFPVLIFEYRKVDSLLKTIVLDSPLYPIIQPCGLRTTRPQEAPQGACAVPETTPAPCHCEEDTSSIQTTQRSVWMSRPRERRTPAHDHPCRADCRGRTGAGIATDVLPTMDAERELALDDASHPLLRPRGRAIMHISIT